MSRVLVNRADECDLLSDPDFPASCITGCAASATFSCKNETTHLWTTYNTWSEHVMCSTDENDIDPEDCVCETYWAGKNCIQGYLDYSGWTAEVRLT